LVIVALALQGSFFSKQAGSRRRVQTYFCQPWKQLSPKIAVGLMLVEDLKVLLARKHVLTALMYSCTSAYVLGKRTSMSFAHCNLSLRRFADFAEASSIREDCSNIVLLERRTMTSSSTLVVRSGSKSRPEEP
jgi:hypothetical protein